MSIAASKKSSRPFIPSPATRQKSLLLDIPLFAVALFSLLSIGYEHFIDLRFGGFLFQTTLPILWSLSVVLLILLRHFAPSKKLLIQLLLAPTYILMACLIVNTLYYYTLLFQNRWFGFYVPTTLIVLLLLAAWTRSVHQTLRSNPRPHSTTLRRKLVLFIYALVCALAAVWFFFFQFRANPPLGPVDLAVVFGNSVLPDGTASPQLEDRVLAAVKLYHEGKLHYIMLSGTPDGSPPGPPRSCTRAMRAVCRAQGIPDSALILDPYGYNTRASVNNSIAVMRQLNLHSVVGVSDDSHLPRIRLTYAAAGIDAYTYPARHELWPLADPRWVAREIAGIIVYKLDPNYRLKEAAFMVMPETQPTAARELKSLPALPVITHPRIVVHKKAHTLELFDGDRLIKTYSCITGRNFGNKEIEGDAKTPEGVFHICYKNPDSKFHLSMGLDYPNVADAERGLREKLISEGEYEQITTAIKTGGIPNWYTKLGGEIFIHGHGEGREGTAGCVAVSNPEIEELYAICDVGTVVEIRP